MKDFYVFILGLFGITEIAISGFRMPVAAPFLLIVLPKALSSCPLNNYTKKMFLFLFLWIIGLVISGWFNNSSSNDLYKQVGKVACLFFYFPVAIWALKDKPQRILTFVLGLGLSGIMQFFVFPVADFQAEVEAAGLEHAFEITTAWFISPFFAAFCSILYYKDYRRLAIIIAACYGIWAVFNNSRMALLIYITTALLLIYLSDTVKNDVKAVREKIGKNYKRALFLLLIGFVVSAYIYQYLAENEMLDERSTEKYYNQRTNSRLGLASGRQDFFTSAYAICFHPFIGYGVPPKDKEHRTAQFGRIVKNSNINFNLVPTHSHLLGAWVQAGLLGVFFWLLMLQILYKYVKNVFLYDYRMWAFSIIYILTYCWDIFFSPYGGARGYRLAFIFSYFIVMIIRKRPKNSMTSTIVMSRNRKM